MGHGRCRRAGAGLSRLMDEHPDGSWHRVLDHTSELRLELGAPSWPELLAEAARALGAQLRREAPAVGPAEAREVRLQAHDAEALLVDYLNEIVFLAETDPWAPTDAVVDEASPTRLVARLSGPPLARAPSAVKAATFHGLAVAERDGRWTARVVLDT